MPCTLIQVNYSIPIKVMNKYDLCGSSEELSWNICALCFQNLQDSILHVRVSIVETGEDSLLTWMDLSCLFSYAIKQVLWKHQQISQQGDGNKSSEKKKEREKKDKSPIAVAAFRTGSNVVKCFWQDREDVFISFVFQSTQQFCLFCNWNNWD